MTEVIQTVAATITLIGVGLAAGSVVGLWRYGNGLGEGPTRTFIFMRRYGFIAALVAAVVLGVSAAVSGGLHLDGN